MKTNCLILIILLAASVHVAAQKIDYTFKVLVNKGKNEVKAGGEWTQLKTGSTLQSGDKVKISDNAYLGLIHKSGKPLEVKQSGTFDVDDLAKKLNANNSVINKYTDFMLSSNEVKKNRLAATGAVHRGASAIKVYLPKADAALLFGNKVIVHFVKEEKSPYVINLKSVFGEELLVAETNDSTFTVNLDDPKFVNEDNIIIEVFPKGHPDKKQDPAFIVKKLSAADKERIRASLQELAIDPADESALSKYLLAMFYEENNLLIDAIRSYQEAIKLEPGTQQYADEYNNFLLRYAIKEKKKID
jgi:hypothetical protein